MGVFLIPVAQQISWRYIVTFCIPVPINISISAAGMWKAVFVFWNSSNWKHGHCIDRLTAATFMVCSGRAHIMVTWKIKMTCGNCYSALLIALNWRGDCPSRLLIWAEYPATPETRAGVVVDAWKNSTTCLCLLTLSCCYLCPDRLVAMAPEQ